MITQTQARTLREKAMELGQALFFNTCDAVLKLPTSVINILHVDEAGQIWFIMNRPTHHINEYDKDIPAKLEFYKKGKDFYLHVLGKATIVSDPEEVNNVSGLSSNIKQQALNNLMLIKVRPSNIYYYSYPPSKHAVRKEYKFNVQPSGLIKTLQYIVKDIIPVFQSH